MTVPPDARLITLCAREPEATTDERIREAAVAVADWDRTVELALRHGVVGYVRQALDRAGVSLPAEAEAGLRHAWIAVIAHVLSLDVHLERVAQSLAAARIPVIVLKGPTLATTIYPAAALRPYGDIDLTVHEADGARAASALEASGFRETAFEPEVARLAHADHGAEEGFHRLFVKPPEGLLFELHLDPLQLGLRPTCEAGRWARALPFGRSPWAQMLGPEDQLVQLSVHAHKHGFSRLIWLKDLELLLKRYGAVLDWGAVVNVAELEGVRSSVWYAIHLASRVLGFAPPPQLAGVTPGPLMRGLYGYVWPEQQVANLAGRARWRTVQFRVADSWRGMLPSLLLMGRKRDRARAIARAVFSR